MNNHYFTGNKAFLIYTVLVKTKERIYTSWLYHIYYLRHTHTSHTLKSETEKFLRYKVSYTRYKLRWNTRHLHKNSTYAGQQWQITFKIQQKNVQRSLVGISRTTSSSLTTTYKWKSRGHSSICNNEVVRRRIVNYLLFRVLSAAIVICP